jgi:hypothetical protein
LKERIVKLLDRVISWVKRVPGLKLVWEIHERFSPLRFFADSTKIVEQELEELQTALREKRPLTICFDENVSPPGLGDALTVAILASGLSNLTKVSIIILSKDRSVFNEVSKNIRLDNSNHVMQVLSEFAPSASMSYASHDRLILETKNHVLFSGLVASKRDITRYMLLLIRELHSRHIAPIEFFKLSYRTLGEGGTRLIGYPLRRSSSDPARNTVIRMFLHDIRTLRANYPEHTVKLFGFEDEVNFFLGVLETNGLSPKVVPQSASSFVDAIREALHCELWVQRLGGGMAVAVFFSELKFIIFSKDSVMARQLGYKTGKLLPWHSSSQIYRLRPFSVGFVKFDRTLSRLADDIDF